MNKYFVRQTKCCHDTDRTTGCNLFKLGVLVFANTSIADATLVKIDPTYVLLLRSMFFFTHIKLNFLYC